MHLLLTHCKGGTECTSHLQRMIPLTEAAPAEGPLPSCWHGGGWVVWRSGCGCGSCAAAHRSAGLGPTCTAHNPNHFCKRRVKRGMSPHKPVQLLACRASCKYTPHNVRQWRHRAEKQAQPCVPSLPGTYPSSLVMCSARGTSAALDTGASSTPTSTEWPCTALT